MPDKRRRTSRPWLVPVAAAVFGVAGTTLQQIGTDPPASRGGLILFIAGTLILLFAAVLALVSRWLHGKVPALLAWITAHVRLPMMAAVVGASLLGLLVGLVSPPAAVAVRRWFSGCETVTEIRVLTSTEQRMAVRDLADAYLVWTADRNGGCPTVNLHVIAATSLTAVEAVASRWSNGALVRIGPHPDVWLPDSSIEVQRAITRAPDYGGGSLPIAENRSIATSPIVLGVPVSKVPAELRSTRAGLAWGRLLTESARQGWDLVRPDPTASRVGELATMALYQSQDLNAPVRDDGNASVRDDGRVRAIELRIESSLQRGGYPPGAVDGLLCRRHTEPAARTPAPPAAVITSEQALVRLNRDVRGGRDCVIGTVAEPERCLYAFYPPDTLSLDYPFVRLDWDGASSPQAFAARDFGAWLTTVDGKRELQRIGLRPPEFTETRDPLSVDLCAEPSPAYSRRPPDPATLAATAGRYRTARRPGRVLLAVDSSGSMQQSVGPEGTRFQVATAGVARSLALLSARDEFGLWVFPGRRGTHDAHVPIGRGDERYRGVGRPDAAIAALRGVAPGGGTPLYSTIVAGVAAAGGDPDALASLVVLTDGADTEGRLRAEDVADQVRRAGVKVFVIVVGAAGCPAGTLGLIARSTGGECRRAGFDTVGDVLVELFGALWSGRGPA
jgi:hypothetical protein